MIVFLEITSFCAKDICKEERGPRYLCQRKQDVVLSESLKLDFVHRDTESQGGTVAETLLQRMSCIGYQSPLPGHSKDGVYQPPIITELMCQPRSNDCTVSRL